MMFYDDLWRFGPWPLKNNEKACPLLAAWLTFHHQRPARLIMHRGEAAGLSNPKATHFGPWLKVFDGANGQQTLSEAMEAGDHVGNLLWWFPLEECCCDLLPCFNGLVPWNIDTQTVWAFLKKEHLNSLEIFLGMLDCQKADPVVIQQLAMENHPSVNLPSSKLT